MGSCLCKKKVSGGALSGSEADSIAEMSLRSSSLLKRSKEMDALLVDQLVLDMLRIIGCFSESEDDSPIPLVKLHCIADKEEGWSQVVMSLIHIIPLGEPLGPSAITIIFDDIPLPPRDAVMELVVRYNLCGARAESCYNDINRVQLERNICVVLGCIAEKFAGPNSSAILTTDTLDYLVSFIRHHREPCVVLYALVAIEKFAHTTENKWTITRYFAREPHNPLLDLESLPYHDYIWRQVKFCARWALDNIFVVENRIPSYEIEDTSTINAMLNSRDVSEYLKISPDGLEARCDSHSFESVRCTFHSDRDCWYYEVEIITPGVMQIGWATKSSVFQNHDGYGVGDDSFSLSYDGCRRLIWHKAHPIPIYNVAAWQPGDILGCLIDIPRREAIFSINGNRLPVCSELFYSSSEGYHAAASFMAHQQCRFNFGNKPFQFPPRDREFKIINEFGTLAESQKKVVPRRIYMEEIRNAPVVEGCCIVCYDRVADSIISPCRHSGFCATCAQQLSECPFCREEVWSVMSNVSAA